MYSCYADRQWGGVDLEVGDNQVGVDLEVVDNRVGVDLEVDDIGCRVDLDSLESVALAPILET